MHKQLSGSILLFRDIGSCCLDESTSLRRLKRLLILNFGYVLTQTSTFRLHDTLSHVSKGLGFSFFPIKSMAFLKSLEDQCYLVATIRIRKLEIECFRQNSHGREMMNPKPCKLD